jgi:hypothetical protein
MKSRLSLTLFATVAALCFFAAAPTASAQTQLLNVSVDVPLAATLDNPCTTALEAIAFTGTTHIDQQVWLMPGGTTRLVLGENTSISGKDILRGPLSPNYSAASADLTDVEFNPGAATLYNYKKVINSAGQDNFHVIVAFSSDANSLQLTPALQVACDDGSPQP